MALHARTHAGAVTEEPLDQAAWASLNGPHARFAQRHGSVARYPEDMAPFLAVRPGAGAEMWDDIAALAGPGAEVDAPTLDGLPDGWEVTFQLAGVQMIDVAVAAKPDAEAVRLTKADVPEMVDLVERARPGPFRQRTIEMGTYLGIRREGALVAMAGERMHPPGWTEISAVCTDPAFRGQGLAARLVLAVSAGIRERGERPFLHAAASNTPAIKLYESLGFRVRRGREFAAVRVPLARSEPSSRGRSLIR
jgi:ribosomal protein S18 acetylase RimI-like enzyme